MEAATTPEVKQKSSGIKDFLFFFRNSLLATQNTIGIDIGQGYIKIVQLQKSRGGYLLTDYRVRAIPFKIKNKPRERDKFTKDFINEFLAQSRVKTSLGRAAIKGNGVFTFSFNLPPLSDRDLKGTVGIELKKRLPFQLDLKNIVYQYFITEKFEDDNPSVMVTCIAVDNGVLDRTLSFLKGFGLRPVVVNLAYDALGNLISALGEEQYQYVGVLDMGAKQSYLNFYKGNALQFTREVPVGGEQLTQGILKALVPLGGDVTFEDAESFKRQCGVPMAEATTAEFFTDFGSIKGEQITTALRSTLERLISEISRTITFYFRSYKLEGLDILYLTGGASRMKNIDRFLTANLSNLAIKNIEKLNPLKAIKGWVDVGIFRQELVMEEAAPHLSVAFGLCLDKGGKINLIPPKEKIEQKALFVMFLTRLTFPVILIIILGFYLFSYAWVWRLRKITNQNKITIQNFKADVDDIDEYVSLDKALNERDQLLTKAIGNQPLWWGLLKELSNITPMEVTLHRLEAEAGKFPKEFILSGEVISEYANLELAQSQYMIELGDSPFFTNVRLISSERDVYSVVPKAAFKIVCELKL
ncbi:MAG: pilus assembly protein PilM [Candidatus Omnitrophota bacterium]